MFSLFVEILFSFYIFFNFLELLISLSVFLKFIINPPFPPSKHFRFTIHKTQDIPNQIMLKYKFNDFMQINFLLLYKQKKEKNPEKRMENFQIIEGKKYNSEI